VPAKQARRWSDECQRFLDWQRQALLAGDTQPETKTGHEAALHRLLKARLAVLSDPAVRREFTKEMQRYLPAATARETVEQESYSDYLADSVRSEGAKAMSAG
jgi:hypothetical protein